jgi:hypothetical protein
MGLPIELREHQEREGHLLRARTRARWFARHGREASAPSGRDDLGGGTMRPPRTASATDVTSMIPRSHSDGRGLAVAEPHIGDAERDHERPDHPIGQALQAPASRIGITAK